MRKLLSLLFLALAGFAAEPKPAALSAEEKLAVRDAQVAALQLQLQYANSAVQIAQAQVQLSQLQVAAQQAGDRLTVRVNELTEKLRKRSGCQACVINNDLTFTAPEPAPAK